MFLCVCLTVATIQALPVIILLGDSVPMLGDNTLLQNYIQDLNILNSDESKMELQNDGSISFEDDLEVEIENSEDKAEEYEIIVLNIEENMEDIVKFEEIIEATKDLNSIEETILAKDLEISDEDEEVEGMGHEDIKTLE